MQKNKALDRLLFWLLMAALVTIIVIGGRRIMQSVPPMDQERIQR